MSKKSLSTESHGSNARTRRTRGGSFAAKCDPSPVVAYNAGFRGIAAAVNLTRFESADYLLTDEDMAAYLAECAEDDDPGLVARALGAIARARNLSQLARETGMTRAGLSRALSHDGNPSFATISKVAKALGLKISVTPAKVPARKTAGRSRRLRPAAALKRAKLRKVAS